MKQTVLVKLAPPPKQHAALLRTLETFSAACNAMTRSIAPTPRRRSSWPRSGASARSRLVYFGGIARRSEADFVAAFLHQSQAEVIQTILAGVHARARIAGRASSNELRNALNIPSILSPPPAAQKVSPGGSCLFV